MDAWKDQKEFGLVSTLPSRERSPSIYGLERYAQDMRQSTTSSMMSESVKLRKRKRWDWFLWESERIRPASADVIAQRGFMKAKQRPEKAFQLQNS